MNKIGIVINNIGSPNNPDQHSVKKYLKEFLMDKYIINIPFLFRYILVHFIIAPIRSKKSAQKYASIWQSDGSPLLNITNEFSSKLQDSLGPQYQVQIGMRYSEPSIEHAIKKLKQNGVEQILFCPMYPQYSDSTHKSAIEEFNKYALKNQFKTQVLPEFYSEEFHTEAWARQLKKNNLNSFDHILFSFHGLPESYVKKNNACFCNNLCCEQNEGWKRSCYRAQSIRTAELIAKKLSVSKENFSISFQSRLGPSKWLGPSTSEIIKYLATQKKKRVLVACPSFVTDCLETLEEINIELKNMAFSQGIEMVVTECLNADSEWVQDFAQLLKRVSS